MNRQRKRAFISFMNIHHEVCTEKGDVFLTSKFFIIKIQLIVSVVVNVFLFVDLI